MTNEAATVVVPPDLTAGLDELAARTGRSRADLATEALSDYLDLQRWQVSGIEEAIRADDGGAPCIPHDRIAAWVASWGTDKELPPPEDG